MLYNIFCCFFNFFLQIWTLLSLNLKGLYDLCKKHNVIKYEKITFELFEKCIYYAEFHFIWNSNWITTSKMKNIILSVKSYFESEWYSKVKIQIDNVDAGASKQLIFVNELKKFKLI